MDVADPSPLRGTAKMFRCPVCDATGKIGTTFGLGGTACNLCQGRCFLNREPTACPSCDAKGGHPALFGLRWNTCRLCHGVKYLMDRPCPCPKCRATGFIKSLGGMFATPCDLCDRQRYLRSPHGRCIKCNFTSSFIKYFRHCINCGGIGYSPDPQHLCPRCNSTGSFRGTNCMLCTGSGVIHYEVVACAKCGGAGELKRTLSLLLGKVSCPTCNGQGFFQASGSTSVPQTAKSKGKRDRGTRDGAGSGDSGGGTGNRVPDEDEDDRERDDWRVENGSVAGGSQPRRQVKGRLTPSKEGSSRHTMEQMDRLESPVPSSSTTTTTGRASTGGINWHISGNEVAFPLDTNRGVGASSGTNGGGDISGVAAGTGMFNPGISGPSESGSAKGKRRRPH